MRTDKVENVEQSTFALVLTCFKIMQPPPTYVVHNAAALISAGHARNKVAAGSFFLLCFLLEMLSSRHRFVITCFVKHERETDCMARYKFATKPLRC
jgi:hypothetical protein